MKKITHIILVIFLFLGILFNFRQNRESVSAKDEKRLELIGCGRGFGGQIKLKVHLDGEEKISDIEILSWQETKEYAQDVDDFLAQFKGRFLGERFCLGDGIDAMSRATVTSQEVVEAVNSISFPVSKKNILRRDIFLLVFVFLALLLSWAGNNFLRFAYLFSVVIFLGFIFNLSFSSHHLDFLLHGRAPGILFWLPAALSVLLGPVWCFWLCPFGAAQDILGRTKLSTDISFSSVSIVAHARYFLLLVFVIFSFFQPFILWHADPLALFFAPSLKVKIWGGIVLFFSLFFFRFWCRYFCPCGAFLSLLSRFAPFKNFFFKNRNACFLEGNGYGKDCFTCVSCPRGSFLKPVLAAKLFKVFSGLAAGVIIFSLIFDFFPKEKKLRFLPAANTQAENMDKSKLLRMIKEGSLSGREAMFYSRDNESAPGD